MFVCASRIQQGWHRFARTTHLAPYYSGVFFHGMDHGPSFEAAQSRLLRGDPLLHAVRTGFVHRTQLYAPSAAPRLGRPARLPCRGVLHGPCRPAARPSPSPAAPPTVHSVIITEDVFSRSVSAGRRSLRPPVLPRFLFALFVVRRTCAPRVGGADESPSARQRPANGALMWGLR